MKGLRVRNLLISIIALIIVVGVSAQDEVGVFLSGGSKLAKVSGQTRRPKIVVDTVKFETSAYASLSLYATFGQGKHSVSASSEKNIYCVVTQLMEDSTGSVNYYAAIPTDKGRRIIIKSSNASDTSTVVVVAILN